MHYIPCNGCRFALKPTKKKQGGKPTGGPKLSHVKTGGANGLAAVSRLSGSPLRGAGRQYAGVTWFDRKLGADYCRTKGEEYWFVFLGCFSIILVLFIF